MPDPCVVVGVSAGGAGTSVPSGVAGGGKGADTTGVGALGTCVDACGVKMGLLTVVPSPVVLGCTHSDTVNAGDDGIDT
eukprot:7855087-Alexandrium_andersonii.AAC.1